MMRQGHYLSILLVFICSLLENSSFASVLNCSEELSSSIMEINDLNLEAKCGKNGSHHKKNKCSHHKKIKGPTGPRGCKGPTGPTGSTGAPGVSGPSFGNYLSAVNDGNSKKTGQFEFLTFFPEEYHGNITYSEGVFSLDNSSSGSPAVYLVNVGYSSTDQSPDTGHFNVVVQIGTQVNNYGNTMYSVNDMFGGGGGGITTIVVVPPLLSAKLLLGSSMFPPHFHKEKVSITIVQIDNNGI